MLLFGFRLRYYYHLQLKSSMNSVYFGSLLEQIWVKNKRLHRENDMPAVIYQNGVKYWYRNAVGYMPPFQQQHP